eukprot:UN02431
MFFVTTNVYIVIYNYIPLIFIMKASSMNKSIRIKLLMSLSLVNYQLVQ